MGPMSELQDRVRSLLDRSLLERDASVQMSSVARAPTMSERQLLQELATTAGTQQVDEDARIRVAGVLGAGGMGIVHSGEQMTLGRDVAVKCLRPECRDDENTLRLVQEAWVAGSLEHPNVLPVYDIAVDEERGPLVVLKRIAGRTWTELLDNEHLARDKAQSDDLLGWHLRTLIQVCNAVELAHSRGILHRDLKPDNVMVGEFGEVYLLDWGLAVTTSGDENSRVPVAEADEIAGTPNYMAPEMFGGELPTERTDVYLLGGILHHIVTGFPPHRGTNILEIVGQLHLFKPSFEDPALSKLQQVCERALAYDQKDRHEDVRSFRLELESFLELRGAAQLLQRAGDSLEELQDELQRASRVPSVEPGTLDDTVREYRQRIYNLFGECRFGFREVLRSWPDNKRAQSGLHTAIETVVDYELQQGEPRAAFALLSGMDEPSEALRARVEVALEAQRAERKELEQLAEVGRAYDASQGGRGRVLIVLIMGILWTATRLTAGLTQAMFTTHASFIGSQVVFIVTLLALGYWQRAVVRRTAVNLAIFHSALVGTSGMIAVHAGGMLSGIDVNSAIAYDMLVISCCIGTLAVSQKMQLWVSTFAFLGGFLVISRWPTLSFYALASADLVLTFNAVVLWWPSDEADTR